MRRRLLDRFAADAVSLPLWLRVVVTVPLLYVGYVLVKSFGYAIGNADLGAAMLLLVLGVYLFYAVPLLRLLWRPSARWRHAKMRDEADARRLREIASRDLAREAAERTFGAGGTNV